MDKICSDVASNLAAVIHASNNNTASKETKESLKHSKNKGANNFASKTDKSNFNSIFDSFDSLENALTSDQYTKQKDGTGQNKDLDYIFTNMNHTQKDEKSNKNNGANNKKVGKYFNVLSMFKPGEFLNATKPIKAEKKEHNNGTSFSA